jgi:serine/threonine-protein kinase
MASVHLARMDGPGGFQKWVAIKRIHPHLIEDDSFIHMFLDEARIAARISHPNVATVFELGKHDDTYWIAMEYLHGEPLREVMRRTEETGSPMPPEIACRVIADAAEGLHAAHELLGKNGEKLNLIHRDVTPHNLFVTYEGNTKVVDFGIAKFSSRMSSTRAGTLKGKLAYMSPEQVSGETIDRRTDIFALGVVLWELTTGQRLFRMESDLDTLAKVQECNIPRPSSIIRGYPIDLEKIVMKALAKNRGERFKTARELSRMLQSLLMRRGLFIASDEVANYVQTIFKERIEKREAHLRWAGEVTQTINIEQLQAGAPVSTAAILGVSSGHSDVQASGAPARQPPRPAAGVPAVPPTTVGPSSRQPGAPYAASPPQRRPDMHVDDEMDDMDDAPTLQATVAQVMAAQNPGMAPPAASVYTGGSGFDDDFEDVNDTIVETHPDAATSVPRSAPLPAAGRPAAPPSAPSVPQRPSAPRIEPRPAVRGTSGPQTLPLNTKSPTGPRGPYAPLSQTAPAPYAYPGSHGVAAPLNISDPSLPQTLAVPLNSSLGAPLPLPSQNPPESEHNPVLASPVGPMVAGGRVPAPTEPRLFVAPPTDRAAQTTQIVLGNRAPWWAITILAATAVFAVTGAILLLVTLLRPSGNAAVVKSSSAPDRSSSAQSAPVPAPPDPTVVASSSPPTPVGSAIGPFVSARSAFLAAIVPQPSSAAPAPPPAAPAPTGVPAEPPASAAAADSAQAPADPPHASAPPPVQAAVTPDPTPAQPQPAAPAPQPVNVTPQPGVPAQPAKHSGAPTPVNAAAGQGLLSIICLPGCDQIYDNGKLLGPSPIFRRPATLGSHKIKLVLNNPSATKTISTIVVADQVSMVRESMP